MKKHLKKNMKKPLKKSISQKKKHMQSNTLETKKQHILFISFDNFLALNLICFEVFIAYFKSAKMYTAFLGRIFFVSENHVYFGSHFLYFLYF